MESKCPRCQQKAVVEGVCGACGYDENENEDENPGWNPLRIEGWKDRCDGPGSPCIINPAEIKQARAIIRTALDSDEGFKWGYVNNISDCLLDLLGPLNFNNLTTDFIAKTILDLLFND